MSRRRIPFSTRLTAARAMLARGAPPAPAHLADQFRAASADTRELHDRIGMLMPLLEPGRNWRQRMDASRQPTPGRSCWPRCSAAPKSCPHLRRGGPQPTFVRLPLHRTDCQRCVQTLRRPPADEDDRCDVCGRPETLTFHPFAVRQGPALIVGDACVACADVLGIRAEVAS